METKRKREDQGERVGTGTTRGWGWELGEKKHGGRFRPPWLFPEHLRNTERYFVFTWL